VRHVFSTSIEAVTRTLALVDRAAIPGDELATGEALDIALVDGGGPPTVQRFRVARRETDHKRHVRKYAAGKLPPERSFRFRGPTGAVDLVASNLETFTMLVRGVDEATWLYHLRNGDVARWLRDAIKDPDLADEVAALEHGDDPRATRTAVLDAIARRYAGVAARGDRHRPGV